jgi:YVTN family beta-propeller protein
MKVGLVPCAIVVDPETDRGYVANSLENTVSVLDLEHLRPMGQVKVERAPVGMALDETSHRAYVSNRGTGTVCILEGMRVLGTVKVGQAPGGMAAGSSGTVYVSNAGSNTVSVIDDRLPADAAPAKAAAPPPSPLIGTQVPAFRLKDERGKVHTLDEYQGKILMLNFFASW